MADFFQHLIASVSWKDAIWEFALGVCVGSFLNVLALRTLAERNPFWGHSKCMHCERNISVVDLIPIASYMLLKGRCRHCQEKISWQYPFVELLTGIMFVVVLQRFGTEWGVPFHPGQMMGDARFACQGWAMVVFISVMIVLCITDFREKLLPHEITYPSMVVGILYSAYTRPDGLMNCLAGVGLSYIIFDFLAFYGLILYRWANKDEPDEEDGQQAEDAVATGEDGGKQSWWGQFFSWQNEPKDQARAVQAKANELPQARASTAASDLPASQPNDAPEPGNQITAGLSSTSEPGNHLPDMHEAASSEKAEEIATARTVAAEESACVAKDNREIDAVTLSQPGPIKFASRVEKKSAGENASNHSDKDIDPFIDRIFDIQSNPAQSDGEEQAIPDDFEVMGGGDAVLAAVIAAWLGLNGLGFTLVAGFLIGTAMGAGYLLYEMHLHGTLKVALSKIAQWCAILIILSEGLLLTFHKILRPLDTNFVYFVSDWHPFHIAAFVIFIGTLLGIVATGRKYSKPFPFGPALALAAVMSIFWAPSSSLPGR